MHRPLGVPAAAPTDAVWAPAAVWVVRQHVVLVFLLRRTLRYWQPSGSAWLTILAFWFSSATHCPHHGRCHRTRPCCPNHRFPALPHHRCSHCRSHAHAPCRPHPHRPLRPQLHWLTPILRWYPAVLRRRVGSSWCCLCLPGKTRLRLILRRRYPDRHHEHTILPADLNCLFLIERLPYVSTDGSPCPLASL